MVLNPSVGLRFFLKAMADNGNGKNNPHTNPPPITICPPDPRLALAEAGVDPFQRLNLVFNFRRSLWRNLGPAENCCYQHVRLGTH